MTTDELRDEIRRLSEGEPERGVLTEMQRQELQRKETRELRIALLEVAFQLARANETASYVVGRADGNLPASGLVREIES